MSLTFVELLWQRTSSNLSKSHWNYPDGEIGPEMFSLGWAHVLKREQNIIENYLCECFIVMVREEITAALMVIFTNREVG